MFMCLCLCLYVFMSLCLYVYIPLIVIKLFYVQTAMNACFSSLHLLQRFLAGSEQGLYFLLPIASPRMVRLNYGPLLSAPPRPTICTNHAIHSDTHHPLGQSPIRPTTTDHTTTYRNQACLRYHPYLHIALSIYLTNPVIHS